MVGCPSNTGVDCCSPAPFISLCEGEERRRERGGIFGGKSSRASASASAPFAGERERFCSVRGRARLEEERERRFTFGGKSVLEIEEFYFWREKWSG